MPRPNAVGKWDMKVDPDTFYLKEDPFEVLLSRDERRKNDLILGLIKDPYIQDVLDIGCGEGHSTPYGAVGIDISYMAIGRARSYHTHCEFFYGDITKGPIKIIPQTWNCIILSEVLYYIKPTLWRTVVENICKMLNVGSQFIISVGQYFTEADIRKMFKDKIEFDKVYTLPNKKYGYWLIMSGHRV